MTRALSAGIRSHLRTNVVGYLAVFIALSGSAYAANKVGSGDIAKNAVLSKHVKKNAIKGGDVKNGALRKNDVRGLPGALKQLKKLRATVSGLGRGGDLSALQRDLAALTARVGALESSDGLLEDEVSKVETDLQVVTSGLNGVLAELDAVGGIAALDERLDSACTQLDALTTQTGDLRDTLNALSLLLGTLNGVVIPDYDAALCQG